MVILEVLFFDIFQGHNKQFGEMVAFMHSKGFVVWDIFGLSYRRLDNACYQADMVFVREGGQFRAFHQYATPEQRREQLAYHREENPKRLQR